MRASNRKITRTEQNRVDYKAAINRQYLDENSATPPERENATRALARHDIGTDGYPKDWDGPRNLNY
jgi:hypothetical protein